jgi:hypothetical protein
VASEAAVKKWILVAVVASFAVIGVAAAAGYNLVAESHSTDLGPCRTEPASETQPTYVVAIGTNSSDAALAETHERHLEEVVLPAAIADNARIVVGTVSGDSAREPTLVADLSLLPTGDGSDNPENQATYSSQKAAELAQCVKSALAARPSDRTDVFGALAWAANVMPPTASVRHVVLLSDAINTTEGCNLTGRDISPSGRQHVFDQCGSAEYAGLAGADVWLGGAGLTNGGDATPSQLTPSAVIEFWTAFVESHGAHVSRAGATLLPTR